jgi:hypothetical protein
MLEPAAPSRDQLSELVPKPRTATSHLPGWFIPLAVVMVVLALALGGMVVSTYIRDGRMRIDPSARYTIHGDVTLFHGVTNLDGVLCEGEGAFGDVHSGAQVTVTDAGGTVIALGTLGQGKLHGEGICQWQFAVSNVPVGKDFYGVEIAQRPRLNYPESDLTSPLRLSLGN